MGWRGFSFQFEGNCVSLFAVQNRDECPPEAIKADTESGLEKWLSVNAEYAKTWPNITVKREPPADSKEWEGKPDKFQHFSPNPGTGD